jgi:hypothetical protein
VGEWKIVQGAGGRRLLAEEIDASCELAEERDAVRELGLLG